MDYEADAIDRAKNYLKEHEIRAVEIGFADINGNIIGKRLPAAFLLGWVGKVNATFVRVTGR